MQEVILTSLRPQIAQARIMSGVIFSLVAGWLSACTPTVRLEVPDKPIVINLNVKIEQEVRIKLEKGVEEVVEENPDIF